MDEQLTDDVEQPMSADISHSAAWEGSVAPNRVSNASGVASATHDADGNGVVTTLQANTLGSATVDVAATGLAACEVIGDGLVSHFFTVVGGTVRYELTDALNSPRGTQASASLKNTGTQVFVYANDSLGQLEGSKTGVLEPGSYQLVTTAAYHNITGVRGPDEGISTAIVTLTFSPVTP